MRVKRRTMFFFYSYRDCGELLSASIAQQTEEEQQRVDAHPVPAWQYVSKLRTVQNSSVTLVAIES